MTAPPAEFSSLLYWREPLELLELRSLQVLLPLRQAGAGGRPEGEAGVEQNSKLPSLEKACVSKDELLMEVEKLKAENSVMKMEYSELVSWQLASLRALREENNVLARSYKEMVGTGNAWEKQNQKEEENRALREENYGLARAYKELAETAEGEAGKLRQGINAREIEVQEMMEENRNMREEKADMVTEIEGLRRQLEQVGNGRLIVFLLDTIQRKERDLECPVCFQATSAPILCCEELHLIWSTCQPRLPRCPECRSWYRRGRARGPRRHRPAEAVAAELEGLREELRQLTA